MSYLDSKRIVGTNTQRVGIPAISGGWKEIGRTTLGSASNDISVSSLADKRYYMILHSHLDNGTSMRIGNRVNNDSGTNYAERRSANGGSDNTNTSATEINITDAVNTAENWLGVNYIANKSDKEKLQISNYVGENTAGAGNAPKRTEVVSKFTNTSDAINRWDSVRISGTGQADSGSEVVVLGYDPDDTHTTNFWEELASVDWSSGGSISSGTISAKKYLWVQAYSKNDATNGQAVIKFNSDGGTNYADRYSYNGGADATNTSNVHGLLDSTGSANDLVFYNMFILNNSANEKLIINHSVNIGGTGAGNAPYRTKNVFKWTNTSSQITDIEFKRHAGNMTAGILKVWGSD